MTRFTWRFIAIGLLSAICGSAAAQAPSPRAPAELRVLSYNIHHGEGTDGRLDLERIARVIRSVDPDLVALQEVDQRVARSRSIDQPQELARLTQRHVAFGGNIELQGGRYGNAVLSRYPLERSTNHLLPRLDDGEQRGVLEVAVQAPAWGRPLQFFATHWDHRRPGAERLASAKAINALLAGREDQPAVLAGDLNAVPDSEPLREIEKRWTRTNPAPLPTIPVEHPTRQIDFILLRPAAAFRVRETSVLDESVASDHRPILAVVELVAPTAAK